MSPHPILSLKSSIGSKSSSSSCFHSGPSSFQPTPSAQCFAYRHENQSPHLHSSWISRLLPTSATSSSGELSPDILPTANFSIIRRHLGFHPVQPISNISRGDGDVGFGPFKVREARTSERESRISMCESRLARGEARVLQEGASGVFPVCSSRLKSCFGPWRVGGEMKTPVYGALVARDGSGLDAARRRGAAYRDINDGGSAPGSVLDIHNPRDNVMMPQQPGIQARKIEAEEPFSFWNMGRVKRANFVSSVSPSFDLSWTFDRKRKLNAEDVNSFKYRRM